MLVTNLFQRDVGYSEILGNLCHRPGPHKIVHDATS